MYRPKLSVAGVVIVALVATTTLLFGVLGYVGYDTLNRRLHDEFDREQAVLADQVATSLALPLWNFDREQLGKVVDSAMQDEDVYRVEVRARGEVTRAAMRTRDANWKITTAVVASMPAGLRLDRRDIVTAGEVIGEVRVFSTDQAVQARMRRAATTIVGVIGLFDALLVVGLYLMLKRTVIRPIEELGRHARAVTSEPDAMTEFPPRNYFGELAGLRASLEKMLGMLRARYIAAKAAEALEHRLAGELRESEEKFSKIFQASPISIVLSEMEPPRIVEANDAFLRTFECQREQVIGHSALELGLWTDPGDREKIFSLLRAGEEVRDFKVRGRSATGAVIVTLISSEFIDLRGRQLLLTMVRDITARERAEESLRESEEKFSRAFRSGPDAMTITEADTGRYLEVNDGFERLFGYSRAETIGRTSFELNIWSNAADRAAFIERLRADGAVRNLELTSVNRRGEPVICQVSAEGMVLAGTSCIVAVIHDVTERKVAEEARARAVESERRARAEFTQRLIASQEAERRRIAGELHDSLGQNLLLIKNRAQMAQLPPGGGSEMGPQLQGITELAARAIAEVRQISHDLRPYQLDQLGLTRALQAMIDNAAQSTAMEFKCKLDPVDDLFSPDAAIQLYRIVQESLNNILKHSGAHQVRIDLERDLQHVRLWIEDDGRGIGQRAAGESDAASGLGLQNLAERASILGGKLTINSKRGEGTRIEVTVPTPEKSGENAAR